MSFRDAVTDYATSAQTMFTNAQRALAANPTGEALKQAQGAMAAAFAQLSQAAKMESEQDGRDGYAEVVELMKRTRKMADIVYDLLETAFADPQANVALINACSSMLQTLAQISPASVWQATPGRDDAA